MNLSTISLLIAFATLTPGPNNLILMRAGTLRRRPWRGLRMAAAVTTGSLMMWLISSTVAHAAWVRSTQLQAGLGIASGLLLVALALASWRAAPGTAPSRPSEQSILEGFWQFTAFQFLNPKGWAFIASLAVLVMSETPVAVLHVVTLILGLVTFTASLLWFFAGQMLGHLISTTERQRRVNRAFGVALLALGTLQLWEVMT